MTLNSSIEKELFTQHLSSGVNKGKFLFHELVKGDKEDWFKRACKSKISCDIIVISGHYNKHFFYGESSEKYELGLSELIQNSCKETCAGIMSDPTEVFLLGCNTLKGNPGSYELLHKKIIGGHTYEFGISPVSTMKRAFANVPGLYGFNVKAPTGEKIAPELQAYLTSIPDYTDHIKRKQIQRLNYLLGHVESISTGNPLLRHNLKKHRILDATGISFPCNSREAHSTDQRSEFYENLCQLQRDDLSLDDKSLLAFDLLEQPFFDMYIPAISNSLKTGRIYNNLVRWLPHSTKFKKQYTTFLKETPDDFEKLNVMKFLVRFQVKEASELIELEKNIVAKYLKNFDSKNAVARVCGNLSYTNTLKSVQVSSHILNNPNGIRMIGCLRNNDPKLASRLKDKYYETSNSRLKSEIYQALDKFISKDAETQVFLDKHRQN